MPELSEVLDDVQREVKRIGEDVPKLKASVEKDLKSLRDSYDAVAKRAAEDGQLANDIKALSTGVAEKHAAIEAAVNKIETEALKAATDRLDSFEKTMNRLKLGGGSGDPDTEMKSARDFQRTTLAIRGQLKTSTAMTDEDVDVAAFKAYTGAYATYLRKGEQKLSQDEMKAVSVGSDPDGGYLVTPVVGSKMLTIIRESSPLRDLAYIEQISGSEVEYPIDEDESASGWVGETENRPETNTARVGTQKIAVHELYAKPRATQKLLEDASIDIEAWLGRKTGEKFGRDEAAAFVTGNSAKRPRGFLTYAAGTTRGTIEQILSGHATAVTFDGLINLTTALKEFYAAGAVFAMRRATVGAVLLLKDGNGQYIWRPNAEAGKPSILLGSPVREFADMPTVEAGALAIAFGNFNQGYTIVDRVGISTLVDHYSAKPFVEFYSRKRVGGDVTNFEAIKLQKIAAA